MKQENRQIIISSIVATTIALVITHGPAVYAATSTFVDGIVIGDTTLSGTLLLDVNGSIGASSFCDAAGANCFTPASVGGGVSGSGTAGYVPKFSAGSTLANSIIQDDGTNVGIGRAPSQKLDVNGNIVTRGGTMFFQGLSQSLYGDGSTALYFDSNNATASRFILRDSDNDQYGSLYGSQGDSIGLLDGDGNWAIQHYKDSWTRWSINNAEQMRLTTTGLGIGTTTPDSTLHLESSNPKITWSDNNSSGDIFSMRVDGGGLKLRSETDAADYIVLNNSGNVGIGTTTPSAALEVVGDIKGSNDLYGEKDIFLTDSNGNGHIIHGRANGGYDYLSIAKMVGGAADWSQRVVMNSGVDTLLLENEGQEFRIRPGYKGSTLTADYTTFEMPGADTLYIWDNLEVSNDITVNGMINYGSNCPSGWVALNGSVGCIQVNPDRTGNWDGAAGRCHVDHNARLARPSEIRSAVWTNRINVPASAMVWVDSIGGGTNYCNAYSEYYNNFRSVGCNNSNYHSFCVIPR